MTSAQLKQENEQGVLEVAKVVGKVTGAGEPPFSEKFTLYDVLDWVRAAIRNQSIRCNHCGNPVRRK